MLNRYHNRASPFMEKQQQKQKQLGGLTLFISTLCGRTVRFISCVTVSVFVFVVLTGWSYGPLFSKPSLFSLRSSNSSSNSSQPLSHQSQQKRPNPPPLQSTNKPTTLIPYPQLICSPKPTNQTCPNNHHHHSLTPLSNNPSKSCPSYFRWIHEDLRPWKLTGITRSMLDKARRTAHFRLIILRGKLYVERYKKSIQTRDVFTIWGVLQLLRRYPGKLPDLELMFDCDDRPVVPLRELKSRDGPPPVFRYCSDTTHLDIVFPDWSFWGWAETNIKPWRKILAAIKEGNKIVKWEDRIPYAYWKGNPAVYSGRKQLMKCNVSEKADWNTRLYVQDWNQEVKSGFNHSNLEDQCTHRYKIYIEGWAWSVSEKYILACDSMTLMIKPRFHDFFSRGLIPLQHYWPIRDNNDKCRSLKFAVNWANTHTVKAKSIGFEGSRFVHENLTMDVVYDYMFHLLNEYGKLQRFEPKVSGRAVEVCPESMGCGGEEWKRFIVEGLEMYRGGEACGLPPAYEVEELKEFIERKINLTKEVERWESEYVG